MSSRWAWILLAAMAIILLYYFFWRSPGVHWRADFNQSAQQPYDLHFTRALLQQSLPAGSFTEVQGSLDKYLGQDSEQAVYVAMGHGLKWNRENEYALTEFVQKGNTAVISMQFLPTALLQMLTPHTDTLSRNQMVSRLTSTEVTMHYYPVGHNETVELSCFYSNGYQKVMTAWIFFHPTLISDPEIIVHGRIEREANLIEIRHDQGKWLLHTNPMAFTNLHMSAPENFEYLRYVFEAAGQYDRLYWDKGNILDMESAMLQDFGMEGTVPPERVRRPGHGPLAVLLSERSFRYAWYLLLTGVFLFMALAAKRRQRPVPVLQKRENTGLDYIQTIGELYFRHGDPREMADLLYRSFSRDFYALYHRVWDPADPEQIEMISKKTLRVPETIQKATEFIQQYSNHGLTEATRLPELRKHIQTILNQ